MTKLHLSRRALLRGAGGVAVGLPFLSMMRGAPARASDPAIPKRLVVFFTPNGFERSSRPTSMTLTGTTLEALTPHASDLIIMRGIDMASGLVDPQQGDGSHYLNYAHMLVGDHSYPGAYRNGGNISFDQLVAQRICRDTRFQSTIHGVRSETSMSWLGPNTPVTAESDPSRAFARLFSELDADPADLDAIRARRQSVLDYVRTQSSRLSCRLGSEDRARLDAHLTAIRDLESRLATAPAAFGAACSAPAAPPAGVNREDNYPELGRLQIDLLVMALACDVTRVGGIQFSQAVGGSTPVWLGLTESHHDLSHQRTDDARAKLQRIDRFYAEQFAYLLTRMKSIPEGTGTMLDNTAILWVSEGSEAGHGRRDVDYVVAGRAGGYLRTGQYLTFSGESHQNLMVELVNAVLPATEAPITTFGNPATCTGGLPRLRA